MSSSSLIVAQILPSQSSPRNARVPALAALPTRRECLVLLTATTAFQAMEMPSMAKDIPLFGLRKSIKKAEEEAELIVKEGFEAAEKEVVVAEKGLEAAEKEVETVLAFGGLAQAGVVAGAEVVGVVIATSVVNAILSPAAQKS